MPWYSSCERSYQIHLPWKKNLKDPSTHLMPSAQFTFAKIKSILWLFLTFSIACLRME